MRSGGRGMRMAGVVASLVLLAGCASGGPALTPMAAPPPAEPEVRGPVLRTGDIVGIDVWRQPEYTGEFVVNARGSLDHPLYQEVEVAGIPIETVEQQIRSFLLPSLSTPQFSVHPRYRVIVGGEVRAPGVYHLAPGTTIADAITEAGGPTERAKNEMELYRGGRGFILDLRDPTAPVLGNTVQSSDRLVMLRRSDFSFFRDLFLPVVSTTSLILQIIRYTR